MNVMTVLKAEISRLAKKEIKKEVSPIKKANASYRGLIASLRKQLDSIQKELSSLKKANPAPDKALAVETEPESRFRMTGQGVKAMRKRLGLTQKAFAGLAGVSIPAVINWEAHKGKINLRKATGARLQEIKGKGKREVAEMLPFV